MLPSKPSMIVYTVEMLIIDLLLLLAAMIKFYGYLAYWNELYWTHDF